MIRNHWWKALGALFVFYSVITGFYVRIPMLEDGGLLNTMRNIFYHVPMWFAMMILFFLSAYHAVAYLRNLKPLSDIKSLEFAKVGTLFSILGMVTGIEWSNYTWSDNVAQAQLWTNDPKQVCAALFILIYFAYFVLRSGIKDEDKRGRIGAVYNIFAFAMMFPLLFIIPRMVDSMHPGAKGNPALNPKDMDAVMRVVFYPAVIGWILMGTWFTQLKVRMRKVHSQLDELEISAK